MSQARINKDLKNLKLYVEILELIDRNRITKEMIEKFVSTKWLKDDLLKELESVEE